jgi:RNA polymerase sigma-70 factor (ECF subfamily)
MTGGERVWKGMDRDPEALAISAAAGDRSAFHDLVLATQEDVRIAIAARVGIPDLVEEVLQRTYIAAWDGLGAYRPEGRVGAWLAGIARNQALHALRERARRRQVPLAGIEDWIAPEPEEPEPELDLVVRLRRCLEALPEGARALLSRRYGDGADLTALAAASGRRPGAVAQQLQRLRDRLRACVAGGAT